MSEPKIEFIGWDKSALELVADKLFNFAEREPDAYRRATVVVPTAQSGRRLRERMAEKAGKPLFMPRTKLLGLLIAPTDKQIADEIETLAAWMEVLTADDATEDFREFFPRPERGEQKQTQTWAVATANRLMQLQSQLEQADMSIAELLRRISDSEGMSTDLMQRWKPLESDETRRWNVIQALFDQVDEKLESRGRVPGRKARERFIENAGAQPSPTLILACVPELSAQIRRYLRNYAGQVRIWVNAPEEIRDTFDDFGCAKPECWAERLLPRKLKEGKDIIITNSAQQLAEAAICEVAESGLSSDEVILGVCDASFTPSLVTEFARHEWQVNVPEGRAFQTTDLAALPGLLATACCAEEGLPLFLMEPVLRNTAIQRLAGGENFDSYSFGFFLDKLISFYIPGDLQKLSELMDTEKKLPGKGHEVEFIGKLRKPEFHEAVTWLLRFIAQCKDNLAKGLRTLQGRLRRTYPTGALAQAAATMAQQVGQLALFLEQQPCSPLRAWALIESTLSQQPTLKSESTRWGTHLDALGWRELTYTDGKLTLLTGMHEHCVPEALPEDPFLPDSLRDALGMPCSRAREARDCFMLSALMSRESNTLRIILSQSSADGTGTPVSPSPLLYHCGEDALTERVKYLFDDLPAEDTKNYSANWTLDVEGTVSSPGGMECVTEQLAPHWENCFAQPEHRFTPSEITAFLKCPLRFWAKYALGLSPWDVYQEDKIEANSAEYGTLVHTVLEYIGRTFNKKENLRSPEFMKEQAKEKLWKTAEEQYGFRLPSMVKIRLNRFERRGLPAFLEWHHEQISDGWECRKCEHEVSDWEIELSDGTSVPVEMRIDRIDYHPETKQCRIIDYKTHGHTPDKKHLEVLPHPEKFVELMDENLFPLVAGIDKKAKEERLSRWIDVQLPMYAWWVMNNPSKISHDMPPSVPEVGYYNLPRSGDADYHGFPLDEELLANAMTWVKSAIGFMREGKCLYSAEMLGGNPSSVSFSETVYYEDPRRLFRTLRDTNVGQPENATEEEI